MKSIVMSNLNILFVFPTTPRWWVLVFNSTASPPSPLLSSPPPVLPPLADHSERILLWASHTA